MGEAKQDALARRDQVVGLISRASAMLGQAKTVQDAKRIADLAIAARVYAQRVRAGRDIVVQAVELRARAERRLGELLDPAREKRGGSKSRPRILKDLGLSKNESSRAQLFASVPAAEFETKLQAHLKATARLSTSLLHSRIRGEIRRRELAAEPVLGGPPVIAGPERPLGMLRHKSEPLVVVELGCNEAGRKLRARIKALLATPRYREVAAGAVALKAKAKALEAQAQKLKQEASDQEAKLEHEARAEVIAKYGPAFPSVDQAVLRITDPALHERLLAMGEQRAAEFLLAGEVREGIELVQLRSGGYLEDWSRCAVLEQLRHIYPRGGDSPGVDTFGFDCVGLEAALVAEGGER